MSIKFEDCSAYEADMRHRVASLDFDASLYRSLWSVVLGLKPVQEGDMWMVLYGDNLQAGIAGFGATPEEAMINFDKEFKQAKSSDLLTNKKIKNI